MNNIIGSFEILTTKKTDNVTKTITWRNICHVTKNHMTKNHMIRYQSRHQKLITWLKI